MGTLPYPLVSDWRRQTIKDYKVFNEKGEVAIRSVFVVNRDGIITYINTSFKADKKEDYEAVFSELEKIILLNKRGKHLPSIREMFSFY